MRFEKVQTDESAYLYCRPAKVFIGGGETLEYVEALEIRDEGIGFFTSVEFALSENNAVCLSVEWLLEHFPVVLQFAQEHLPSAQGARFFRLATSCYGGRPVMADRLNIRGGAVKIIFE